MAQIDDLNQAQAAVQTSIDIVTEDIDNLALSATALGERIAALPTGPNLQPNIDLANAQAAAIAAQGDRIVAVKTQLDGFAT